MATSEHDKHPTDDSDAQADPSGVDPRDTDHPTGAKQAAENAAADPPS